MSNNYQANLDEIRRPGGKFMSAHTMAVCNQFPVNLLLKKLSRIPQHAKSATNYDASWWELRIMASGR